MPASTDRLQSALRSDSNAKVSWYVQRKDRDGKWETLAVIQSGCNDGIHGSNGVLATMRRHRQTNILRKYRRADALGNARIVTWDA